MSKEENSETISCEDWTKMSIEDGKEEFTTTKYSDFENKVGIPNKISTENNNHLNITVPHQQNKKLTNKQTIDQQFIGCLLCDSIFTGPTRKVSLERHLLSHTREKPYTCTEPNCDKAYHRNSELLRHVRTSHLGLRPFTCTECSRKFQSVTTLNNHMASHSDERSYACDKCDKTYKYKQDLAYHERKVHGKLMDLKKKN